MKKKNDLKRMSKKKNDLKHTSKKNNDRKHTLEKLVVFLPALSIIHASNIYRFRWFDAISAFHLPETADDSASGGVRGSERQGQVSPTEVRPVVQREGRNGDHLKFSPDLYSRTT
ncbi:hypothetical protein AVEN_84651-1 [Araneus ventricosus]|uniref:Uncharacterized protein n=1 Tax=Araneus ventricosus TaxID=182803 RepID=A0A4Y2HK23_ARAVE|nr:hypothetical protein AVEN_84651-1 [Araneus ventricosus]